MVVIPGVSVSAHGECGGLAGGGQFRLHPLKGEFKGYWTVTVRVNWRVIFRFVAPDAFDADYVDYH
jgi:plasmid maintenance system killer protein